MIERLETATVGEIVATDFRTAAVFEKFGIDFCCGGRRSLTDACQKASADPSAVIQALRAVPAGAVDDDDVTRWSVDRLVDHIVATHHDYVREAVPAISRHLAKIASVHGERHPELVRVADVFEEVGAELMQHLVKEEQVLFPYVRDLAEQAEQPCGRASSPFGTVENPIRMMEREHREAADGLRIVRELTHEYATPGDGCTTYAVTMEELAHFERDLHRHVHLENNVLFPRAIALENGTWSHDRN